MGEIQRVEVLVVFLLLGCGNGRRRRVGVHIMDDIIFRYNILRTSTITIVLRDALHNNVTPIPAAYVFNITRPLVEVILEPIRVKVSLGASFRLLNIIIPTSYEKT